MTASATQARSVVRDARSGSLGTLDAAGSPFVSLVAVVEDGAGSPLFLFSGLAEHTRNLRRRAEASLMIAAASDGHSMDRARVTLTGKVVWLSGDDADSAKARFIAALPEAQVWAALPDFAPARLEVESVRFVGGFARAATVPVADYLQG